jgi:hypothetical protein
MFSVFVFLTMTFRTLTLFFVILRMTFSPIQEQWGKWFAAFDSYQGGQPHFFPGICNVNQFKEQMELRGVKRKEIPTLKKKKQN